MTSTTGDFWIKICGVQSPETARAIARLEVNAIGLNRYPHTHRFVTLEQAQAIVEAVRSVDSGMNVVAVYVDVPVDQIRDELETIDCDYLQLHGNETPETVREVSGLKPVIKAISLPETGEVDWEPYPSWGYLFDHHDPEKVGGTGRAAPWDRLQRMNLPERWILAGGLDGSTVEQAIRRLRPWGVDVASGVEAPDGTKDLERVEDFVRKARSAVTSHRKESSV